MNRAQWPMLAEIAACGSQETPHRAAWPPAPMMRAAAMMNHAPRVSVYHQPDAALKSTEETCDGVDNDGDGEIDEGACRPLRKMAAASIAVNAHPDRYVFKASAQQPVIQMRTVKTLHASTCPRSTANRMKFRYVIQAVTSTSPALRPVRCSINKPHSSSISWRAASPTRLRVTRFKPVSHSEGRLLNTLVRPK